MTREAAYDMVCMYGDEILASAGACRMKDCVQHGSTSVYEHSVSVATACVRLDKLLPGSSDTASLVRGALLHDYFLYDWHDRKASRPHHATRHPLYALENAEHDFDLSPTERDMIACHMFPLPPTRIPHCREAWILALADKGVSLTETVEGFIERLTHA